jgi:hypothetical protein
MIRSLNEEVEEVVRSALTKATLASHVPGGEDVLYSINTFVVTAVEFTEGGPKAHQELRLGVTLMVDDTEIIMSTQWSCAIENYTPDLLREELVKVWDAFVITRMERSILGK